MSAAIKVRCPKCGYRYLMTRALLISRDEIERQTFSADIIEPDKPVVCAHCGYEGPLPPEARMMLLDAERLPGM